jgi:hypothetical protein
VKKRTRSRSGRRAIARKSKAKLAPPEIYVRYKRADGFFRDCLCHLRNKGGYVYLSWREDDRVRSFYLGKAPRKSPTGGAALRSPAADGRARQASSPRRGKLRGSR